VTKTATIHAQQKWEYLELTRKTETYLCDELNDLGKQGWELVTTSHGKDRKGEWAWTAFLKRPYVPGTGGTETSRESAASSAPQEEPRLEPSDADGKFDLDGDEFKIAGES
jgi:hypothetical protein